MANLSPLHVLLTAMNELWEKDDLDGAVAIAKAAAPYVHVRAAASKSPGTLSEVPDEQLGTWHDGEERPGNERG